ncbi:hypothetical protein VNI00_003049 [Paramarasmius palmivorus]|uniref:Securin n=1 Tax=Paramarasmius palmivorus TaxID=297713 RepID=A0AAW0DZD2_9AGAR
MSTTPNKANSAAEEIQQGQAQKVTNECSKSIAQLLQEAPRGEKQKYTESSLRTGAEKQNRENRRAGASPYNRGSTEPASVPAPKRSPLPRRLSKAEDLQVPETLEPMVLNGTFPTFDVDTPLSENEDLNISLNVDEVAPVDFPELELGYDEGLILPPFYRPRNVQGW